MKIDQADLDYIRRIREQWGAVSGDEIAHLRTFAPDIANLYQC
jgi:hypothetical protein